jgi:hypothetical protein
VFTASQVSVFDEWFKFNSNVTTRDENAIRKTVSGLVKILFPDLKFSKEGIQIDNLKYSYDGFECALFTSNYLNLVNLVIVFSRTVQGDNEDGDEQGVTQFSLPLNLNL